MPAASMLWLWRLPTPHGSDACEQLSPLLAFPHKWKPTSLTWKMSLTGKPVSKRSHVMGQSSGCYFIAPQ